PDGYDGDVLFENLELCRIVEAAGGRHLVALDLYVRRLPPPAWHLWSPRLRQAYDEFARPRRMAAQLATLPLALLLVASGRRRFVLGAALASMAIAEGGRRRSGGRRYFSPVASLLAPVWIAERAVCAWLALGSRVRHGGVPYGGGVLARAATPARVLGERHARGAR
ncbi:MAG: glycosyltransferase family 2 protein, partial [Dehalococcoidia bacterium]